MPIEHPNDPKIIVALDYPSAASALRFAESVEPNLCKVKVGGELFTSAGPQIVEKLVSRGFDVFLDLKFHDIPNTVAAACRAAADLGIWMLNVHAMGGRRMLEAAWQSVQQVQSRPYLVAVTLLTSMQAADLHELSIQVSPTQFVRELTELVLRTGLDGVVCSAHEAADLRRRCSEDFKLVTPGIRSIGMATNDQRRVMTAREALQSGADYLVIGRPITQSVDPRQKLLTLKQEIADL